MPFAIIAVIVVLLIILVYFIYSNREEKNYTAGRYNLQYGPRTYDWKNARDAKSIKEDEAACQQQVFEACKVVLSKRGLPIMDPNNPQKYSHEFNTCFNLNKNKVCELKKLKNHAPLFQHLDNVVMQVEANINGVNLSAGRPQ